MPAQVSDRTTYAVAGKGHRKGYRRRERVGEALKEVLGEALERRVDDPRVGFVTVTAVDAAPDLKTARVYVSVLGGDPDRSLKALGDAAPVLQREIARSLRLMWTPKLTFTLDEGPERAFRITRLLDSVSDDAANDFADDPKEDPR